jgi:hypothetical protein
MSPIKSEEVNDDAVKVLDKLYIQLGFEERLRMLMGLGAKRLPRT